MAAISVLWLLAGGCSTVPDWSVGESREMDVWVRYHGAGAQRSVPLPTSSPHLTILELRTTPEGLLETYTDSGRELRLPRGSDAVHVRCRYRLLRRFGDDGAPMPWPTPQDIFPGADQILDGGAGDEAIDRSATPEPGAGLRASDAPPHDPTRARSDSNHDAHQR